MIQAWKRIERRLLGDYRVFRLNADRVESPRTGDEHEFYVLDCADWVNVVAITDDRRVVMVEQYRHGSNTVELELPGGLIDAADASPVAAGLRELREETGYEGQNARSIGQVWANPALFTNRCHTILVEHCEPRHEVQWDHGEDLVTRMVAEDDLPGLVAGGQIRHSLIVAALHHFDLFRRGLTGR